LEFSQILFEETKSEDAFLPLMGVHSIGPDQSKTQSEACRVSTDQILRPNVLLWLLSPTSWY